MTQHTFFVLASVTATGLILLSACTLRDAAQSGPVAADVLESTLLPAQRNDEVLESTRHRHGNLHKKAMSDLSVSTTSPAALEPETGPVASAPLSLDTRSATEQPFSGEKYLAARENSIVRTHDAPVSTFSVDVDTGSYANVRRFVQQGLLPPPAAVRVEEMLNYFTYDYPATAKAEQPFSIVTEIGPSPWNSRTQLLHIGLKGYSPHSDSPPANLVFLIDVSGSMNSPNKLGLLSSSISLLTNELDSNDIVSIVVYAGSSGVVLEPTAGNEHVTINKALSQLQAGGSTHGSQGIELAYKLAGDNYLENGINRVILATDGDFNVGISDTDSLKQLISQKRQSGIALTTLGFGTGNYNDHLMEQLANTGNGSYAYIDTLSEAQKVLVDERHSTMMRIASDVKIQIEFNPERVSEYRLIGYSNRRLANEDFSNDRVDAGDIGAGHTVTALYEIALVGEGAGSLMPLRYTQPARKPASEFSHELAEIRLRYKLPGETDSHLIKRTVDNTLLSSANRQASDNFRFSASVAGLGQLLTGSTRINDFDFQDVQKLALGSIGDDPFGYRREFIRLVNMVERLHRMHRVANSISSRKEG